MDKLQVQSKRAEIGCNRVAVKLQAFEAMGSVIVFLIKNPDAG